MKTGSLMLAKRYAIAFDSLSKDTIQAQKNFASFKETLKQIEPIKKELNSPVLPFAIKQELLTKFNLQKEIFNLLLVLIKANRFALIKEIENELQNLLYKREGVKPVLVQSAKQLTLETKQHLEQTLNAYFKTRVIVSYELKPEFLAGLKIKVDDLYIESSILGRLNNLHDKLKEG